MPKFTVTATVRLEIECMIEGVSAKDAAAAAAKVQKLFDDGKLAVKWDGSELSPIGEITWTESDMQAEIDSADEEE